MYRGKIKADNTKFVSLFSQNMKNFIDFNNILILLHNNNLSITFCFNQT